MLEKIDQRRSVRRIRESGWVWRCAAHCRLVVVSVDVVMVVVVVVVVVVGCSLFVDGCLFGRVFAGVGGGVS